MNEKHDFTGCDSEAYEPRPSANDIYTKGHINVTDGSSGWLVAPVLW